MTKQYLVIERKTCPKCDGSGMEEVYIYRLWWAHHDSVLRASGYPPSKEAEIAWFMDWSHDVKRDGYPPEEVECPACNGDGHIDMEIPLAEALARLPSLVE